jgi:trehalose-phosphatase
MSSADTAPLVDAARAADAINSLRGDRHLLLLIDFDGTLCEFDPDPDAVHLPDRRRELLLDLGNRPDVTLGIVTGRRLEDVRRRTQLGSGTYYAGLHGLQISGPGVTFVHPDVANATHALRKLVYTLGLEFKSIPGVFVEDKTYSIAAHFREASALDAARVPEIVQTHAASLFADGTLRSMSGAAVIELLPNIDWNKGNAVAWIREMVASTHADPAVVYIGDDVTDEDGFRVVRSTGLAIAASDRIAGAHFHIDGPPAVEQVLRAI